MSLARKVAILICAAGPLLAAPTLTTIQDTIYKADGTKFNGTAVISWRPFDASDNSKIGLQSLTVSIVNGNFRVQLVPNSNITPAGYYTVQYQSAGKAQFTETWSVNPSATTLRIKDVRVTTDSSGSGPGIGSGGGVASPPGNSPVPESQVTGLLTDLSLRPMKGSDYGNGRAAMVDSGGALNTVDGNLTDCVRVDGTSTACFDPTVIPAYVDGETPVGVVDGNNSTFTLAATPNPTTSLRVYRNGLLLQAVTDYNIQGNGSILFVSGATPQLGDVLTASYRTSGGSSASLSGQIVASGLTTGPAQVICSNTGSATASITMASLGSCLIPANTLNPGDRVDVRFTFAHAGSASGFVFQILWGAATLVQRTASQLDASVAGVAGASIGAGAVTLDGQTWGSVLPLAAVVSQSTDPLSSPLKIDFQAQLNTAGTDSVHLQNYTVLRYSAQ
jgi:hypothetical protein